MNTLFRGWLDAYLRSALKVRLQSAESDLTTAARLLSNSALTARTQRDRLSSSVSNMRLQNFTCYLPSLMKGNYLNDRALYTMSILYWCSFRVLTVADEDQVNRLFENMARQADLVKLSHLTRIYGSEMNLILLEHIERSEKAKQIASVLPDSSVASDFNHRLAVAQYWITKADNIATPSILEDFSSLELAEAFSLLKEIHTVGDDDIVQKIKLLTSAQTQLFLRPFDDQVFPPEIERLFASMRATAHICLVKSRSVYEQGAARAEKRAELIRHIASIVQRP